MSDFRFNGSVGASGHGQINITGDVNFHGSVLNTGSLRRVSDVQAGAGLSNLPPEVAELIGRQHELGVLARHLEEPGRVAVVTGLGGVGKSALASTFAHLWLRRREAPAWWLAAGSPTELDNGLADLIYRLQPELAKSLPMEEAARRAVRWLLEHDEWLLVLDDVTDPAHVDPLLADLAGSSGRALVTTRLSYGWRRPDTEVFQLQPLAPDAAAELLADLLRKPGAARPAESAEFERELRELALELGGLPLALALAGAYLRKTGISSASFRRRMSEHLDTLGGVDAWAGHLVDAIGLALRAVSNTPGALRLLRVLSWYSHEPVPVALLSGSDGPAAGRAVLRALRELRAHGLVQLGDNTVSVHRHVQTLVRTADDRDSLRSTEAIAESLATATDLLDQYVPPVHESRSWPRWQELLPHITALADQSAASSDTPVTARLFNRTGLFLCEQGAPGDALVLLERSHAAYQRILGDDHPAALAALRNVAGALQACDRIDEAVVSFQRALDSSERVLGPDDPATLGCRADLAGALLARADSEAAVDLLEHALADCARIFGSDHPETLTVTANLAYAYRVADRLERAIPLLERALVGRRRILGDDHPTTLVTRHNLAGALHAAGDLARALPMLQDNLTARLRVLGGDHPETLTSRNSLAYALLSAGQLDLAVRMLQDVLTDRERVLGPDSPGTITSRSNLAAAYWETGDLGQAAELFERTISDCLRRLGTDHPDTLAARQNLAGVYRAAGQHEEALALFELNRAETERLLGPEHPDTLTARNNLAAAYWENNDFPQALPLLEREVDHCVRLLGERHTETLAARSNLSLALLTTGAHERALPLLERVVADYKQVLGPDHHATLTAVNNLAGTYEETGRLQEALALYESNLEQRTRVLGPRHPDVLASLNNLAGAYKESERQEEALALYQVALPVCQETLGESHPLTRTIRRNLSVLTGGRRGGEGGAGCAG
ncbi:tetratricopeptide repeat protein [Streptomyces sp. NPDC047515]|uniref:tetratricopeptide repeat protein n=1 Tax=Streptomyces sp. NPDC047515 TaxID=3155380 RepID=UPI0033F6F5CD